MNRLSSFRAVRVDPKKVSPLHLSSFGKRKTISSTPVTTSFGRGYGIPQNSRPLVLSNTSLDVPLSNSVSQMYRGMATRAKEAEVVGNTKDNFDTIRSSIATLCDKEIEHILDFERDSIQAELGSSYLAESGYQITEERREVEDGEVMYTVLTKEANNTSVKISFRVDEEEEEEGDYENEDEGEEEEEDYEDEEPVKNLREHPEFESLPRKHPVEIELTVQGKQKGQKEGAFFLEGFAGIDNRLYLDEIVVAKEGEKEASFCIFDDLSDEIQDRIYDYLDSLGVDDKLALFVKVMEFDFNSLAATCCAQEERIGH